MSVDESELGTEEAHRALVEVIAQRHSAVQARITDAGGSLERTRVLAVTKTHGIEVARAAIDVGLVDLGENYGQEIERKAPMLDRPEARWHMIGGLQRNKVKKIAGYVALWQTVDRIELVSEIAKRAPGAAILIQVNTTQEAQKSGANPDKLPVLLEAAHDSALDVRGLMTIGPTDGSDPAPGFALLRSLADNWKLPEVSMGMTADLERAVQEGSTMIRVGTALFGARPAAGQAP